MATEVQKAKHKINNILLRATFKKGKGKNHKRSSTSNFNSNTNTKTFT
jgi:hypothetical protein